MDITNTQQNDFDDSLINVPEEVQDFMFSDDFDVIFLAIQRACSLTESEREFVKSLTYSLLVEDIDMDELTQKLMGTGMKTETVANVVVAINEEILTRVQHITEFYSGDEETDTVSDAPSPADVIETIKRRLTQPQAIAPTARRLDISKTPELPAPPKPTPRQGDDPYREKPL